MLYIKKFEEIGLGDIASVGGKNASLGEMIVELGSKGVRVPTGFAIVADAYRAFITENNLDSKISDLLSHINKEDLENLKSNGEKIRTLIKNGVVSDKLKSEIQKAYSDMEKIYGEHCDVAVRSSATAEDLPEASFAGQQETYLNISGSNELIKILPIIYSSLFTDRAISYRIDHGFEHMDIALSVGVQKMVRSDLACSGVMFTLDTESGFPDVIFITSSYGLGENIVQGMVNPDEFYVHKPTLKLGFKPILKKRLGTKALRMVYSDHDSMRVRNENVKINDQHRFSLNNDEILELAKMALTIEDHYSTKKGHSSPMDIEWAKDGKDGLLYIVQARPETVHSRNTQKNFLEEYLIRDKSELKNKTLLVGKSIGKKIVSGNVRVIESANDMARLQPGEILVTDMTDPDWEPIMKRAGGIITNRGGRTCHAAIVSRELGIPAIVGVGDATTVLKDGEVVTIDCSAGEEGTIYRGKIDFDIKKIEIDNLPKLSTKIMMNIGNPDEAFKYALLPNDGVGLARLEFIINSAIQIHPMALAKPDMVENEQITETINRITCNYKNKKQFFIDKLSEEAGTIAAAFYPKPVVIRLSDFKSNEYRKLIGGEFFEPVEENPMIGFRGASRYYNPAYQPAFALECAAMRKIRNEMGLTNVIVMVPFVRSLKEAKAVIDEMQKNGLVRGENGLEIIMMCEIPSNVILIDKFSEYFDGYSIGSNDLTQLTLAVDRDSELVASLFDERDPAVIYMLEQAITGAIRNKKHVGICGQAPSDYPEIAKMLVELSISSISLNPDTVVNTILMLGEQK